MCSLLYIIVHYILPNLKHAQIFVKLAHSQLWERERQIDREIKREKGIDKDRDKWKEREKIFFSDGR